MSLNYSTRFTGTFDNNLERTFPRMVTTSHEHFPHNCGTIYQLRLIIRWKSTIFPTDLSLNALDWIGVTPYQYRSQVQSLVVLVLLVVVSQENGNSILSVGETGGRHHNVLDMLGRLRQSESIAALSAHVLPQLYPRALQQQRSRILGTVSAVQNGIHDSVERSSELEG